jgi:hypothetical protein
MSFNFYRARLGVVVSYSKVRVVAISARSCSVPVTTSKEILGYLIKGLADDKNYMSQLRMGIRYKSECSIRTENVALMGSVAV